MEFEGILHLFPFTLLSAFAVARIRAEARERRKPRRGAARQAGTVNPDPSKADVQAA